MQSRTRTEIAVFDSRGLKYQWCNYTTRSLYQNYVGRFHPFTGHEGP